MRKPATFSHPRFGKVYIVTHPTSGKISARWRNDILKVVVPVGTSKKRILDALSSMETRILETKRSHNRQGDIVLPDWSVHVVRQSAKPESIIVSPNSHECELQVGSSIDLESDYGNLLLAKAIMSVGKKMAVDILIPRAKELADKLDCRPAAWQISHGRQILGHCSSNGKIALSYMAVFLTPDLRDYIICHELAHLTHMNHSDAFHKLCDQYLEGKEKELRKQLKNYRWPVKR